MCYTTASTEQVGEEYQFILALPNQKRGAAAVHILKLQVISKQE